jgi:outer membrane protein assembly factor BamB
MRRGFWLELGSSGESLGPMSWPRAILTWVLGAVCLLGVERAAYADRAPCSPGLGIDWTFRASSPAVAPAQVRAGRVFLASQEGAIHVVSARGKFLWTYTVEGGLPWGIDVDARGHAYVAGSTGVLYELSERGTVTWTNHSFLRPSGRAVRSALGLLFVAAGRVLNVSPTHPSAGWGVDMGAEIVSGPLTDEQGRAWLVTRNGILHRVKTSFFHARYSLPEAVPGVVLGVTPVVTVLQGQRLSVYDQDGTLAFSHDGVRSASTTGDLQVGFDRTVTWLEPKTGLSLGTQRLADTVSDAPLLVAGVAYVPTEQGVVHVLTADGHQEFCKVASAPLFTPTLNPATGEILVTAGNGNLAAIRFRRRSR